MLKSQHRMLPTWHVSLVYVDLQGVEVGLGTGENGSGARSAERFWRNSAPKSKTSLLLAFTLGLAKILSKGPNRS